MELRYLRLLLLLLTLSSQLISCQNNEEALTLGSDIAGDGAPKEPNSLPLETNYQLKCAAGEECDRGIGHIHIQDENKKLIRRCTGFLIAPDTVATTNSCLATSTDNCKGLVFIVFEKAGELRIEKCQNIIERSDERTDESEISSNFAFFKLEKPVTYKRPIPLSLERTDETNTPSKFIKIATITPKGGQHLISTSFCEWLNFSSFMPDLNSQKHPLIPLSGCEFFPEAEGGVVLNESFYAQGIIAPKPKLSATHLFRDIVHQAPLSNNFMIATHAHCTQPGNDYCEPNISPEERKTNLQKKMLAYLSDTIHKESFKPWSDKHAQYFQWKLGVIQTPHTKDHYFFPLPLCVKKPKDWPKELSDADIFFAGRNMKVKMELPIWKVEPWLNELSLLSSKTFLNQKRNEADEITFNIRLLRWAQTTTLSIDLAPPYLSVGSEIVTNLFNGNVPRCN